MKKKVSVPLRGLQVDFKQLRGLQVNFSLPPEDQRTGTELRNRDRQRETERDRERQRETERDRERETERDRESSVSMQLMHVSRLYRQGILLIHLAHSLTFVF